MEKSDFKGEPDADLFDQLGSTHSVVASKPSSVGMIVIAIMAVGIGGIAFASLYKGQLPPSATTQIGSPMPPPGTTASLPAPTHIVSEPTVVEAAPMTSSDVSGVQGANLADTTDDLSRLQAPGVVVDASGSDHASALPESRLGANDRTSVAKPEGADSTVAGRRSSNDDFQARVTGTSVDTAVAARMADTTFVAPQGTIIPAILETAINSDLPGFVRAVVSRDVHGFDGTRVVIPRGSKLIGQYKSGVSAGQSRAFVIWSRLITPQGVSVDLASPAIDVTGVAGVKGETNTHFLTRFGSSILLSVIDAGLNVAVAQASHGVNSVVIGSPQQAANAATVALQRNIDTPITITVTQGTPIRAFVARDLDFSAVVSGDR